jgi:hypothetical protein
MPSPEALRQVAVLLALSAGIGVTAYWSQVVGEVDRGGPWVGAAALIGVVFGLAVIGVVANPDPGLSTWAKLGRGFIVWSGRTGPRTFLASTFIAVAVASIWWLGPHSLYHFTVRCNGASRIEWRHRSGILKAESCPMSLAMWQPLRNASGVIADIRCFTPQELRFPASVSGDFQELSCQITILRPTQSPLPTTPHAEPSLAPTTSPSSVVEVAEILNNPLDSRTALAEEVLLKMEPERSVRLLVELLKNSAPGTRAGAAVALGVWGPRAGSAVPDLAAALRDSDGSVRAGAAKALKHTGPSARAAVPSLKAALHDRDWAVRVEAAVTLVKVARSRRRPSTALGQRFTTLGSALA